MRIPGIFLSLIVLILLTPDISCQENAHMSITKVIKDKIFKDYDKLIRPLNDTGYMTHVKLRVDPKYIVDLDEDKSIFTMDCFLGIHWIDPRLKWSMSDTNIEYIAASMDTIWKPDISLWNSRASKVAPYEGLSTFVRYNGEIYWYVQATTSTFCPVTEADDVTCGIGIGSWAHDGFEMDLDVLGGGLNMWSFSNVNPRWDLKVEAISVTRRIHNYSAEDLFVSLKAEFPLVRRPSPLLRLVRAPCILASVLMLALLCVPPQQCYARVLFGAILFLVLNVLMLYASASAKTVQAAKNAEALVRSTTIVLTIFLVMQVVTMRLSHCSGPSRPNAALLRWLTIPIVGRALFWKRSSSVDGILPKEGDATFETSAVDEWALVASAVDRILFVICVPVVSFLLLVD